MQLVSESKSNFQNPFRVDKNRFYVSKNFHRASSFHQPNNTIFRSINPDSWCPCDGTCPMCMEAKNHAKSIQTKLKISKPGDIYEEEADRIAEQVMKMPVSDSLATVNNVKEQGIDRKCSACDAIKGEDEEEELNINRKSSTSGGLEANSEVITEINKVRSAGGSPLETGTKNFMESRFGHEFSNVRIYADSQAENSRSSKFSCVYDRK